MILWHRRLGHPGTSTFQKIIRSSHGIPANVHPKSMLIPCEACSKGKLITRPAPQTSEKRIPNFLERIHADVCGPIEPQSGPFRYFLAIICASSKWSRVSLLSTRNMVLPRILGHILRLKAQFLDFPIKVLRVDNAGEFTSKHFKEFCNAAGIDIQYSVSHVHFQNGMVESLIKRLQTTARPILMQMNLPTSAWGHAVLHAAALLNYRPSAFNSTSPHKLAFGTQPGVAHLRTFGCKVMVPILGPKQTKMGPQRQEGIYIGFDLASIIRYLEPTTSDVFKARFTDCHFYEDTFPTLKDMANKKSPPQTELIWQSQAPFTNDLRACPTQKYRGYYT